jgi:hypothetical protein
MRGIGSGAGVTITAGVILAGACRGTGRTNPAYIAIGGTVPGQVLMWTGIPTSGAPVA